MSERGGVQPTKRRDAPVKGRQRRADAALKLQKFSEKYGCRCGRKIHTAMSCGVRLVGR